jgi:hypothetical protein
MDEKDINNLNKMADKLEIVFEKDPNSIEGKYEIHCAKLNFNDCGFLKKSDMMNISDILLKSIDLDEIQVDFSNEELIEDKIYIKAIDVESFTDYLVLNLIDYFNKLLKDTEIFSIHKIIGKIEIIDRNIIVYSYYKKLDYNFETEDIQYKAIDDYLILKEEYGLSLLEIKELSKKQKRYLIYKAKNKEN